MTDAAHLTRIHDTASLVQRGVSPYAVADQVRVARWDLEKDGWPSGEIELRACVGGRCLGRFMRLPEPGAVPPPMQTRLVAVSLADQVGAVMSTAGPPLDH